MESRFFPSHVMGGMHIDVKGLCRGRKTPFWEMERKLLHAAEIDIKDQVVVDAHV